ELINCIYTVTKKYGNLTRLLVGTDIYVVLTKPEDYKVRNYTALQYNNYNVTLFQELKPIFNNYWDHVEQIRANVSDKSCDVQNTITEATSFAMLMLAIYTDVQEKLRQEILVTFNNDKIDAQRLLSMRYLHMVIQETLRLFPIVPIISRQLTGDIKLESCTLPEGCYIMIPTFAIHRNPAYWYKPLEFIPERFLTTRHRYTYIPFGMGFRDCIGKYFHIKPFILKMV
ncbi:Cytochrome P450 3A13, partial [Trachymyrmex cornetzi]